MKNARFLCHPPSIRAGPEQGMSIVEIAVGVALLSLVAAGAFACLISLNKNAVRTRIMTNAKEVVRRNIETAVGLPFSSSSVPSILQITGPNGSVWDDDGGGDNQVTLYISRDGTDTVKGTLTRIVQAEANSVGADIRRVTFHLDYSLFGTPASYEITTLRATDK
jgi:hypothetical protein